MKVAVTMYRGGFSPRLDIADSLWIYLIDKDRKTATLAEKCGAPCDPPAQWLHLLREKGINTVICGGCPPFFLRMLIFNGIEVAPGVLGDPNWVLDFLARGKPAQDAPVMVDRFSYRSCQFCCQEGGAGRFRNRKNNEGGKKCPIVTEQDPSVRDPEKLVPVDLGIVKIMKEVKNAQ